MLLTGLIFCSTVATNHVLPLRVMSEFRVDSSMFQAWEQHVSYYMLLAST